MELSRREGDGATLRTHLQRLARNTGRVDERLLVEVPRPVEQLWDLFMSWAVQRRSGMSLHPLTFTDIEAWCRLYGVRLTPWELDTLLELDAATLRIAAENQRRAAAATKPT
jgi:hypothetical protein